MASSVSPASSVPSTASPWTNPAWLSAGRSALNQRQPLPEGFGREADLSDWKTLFEQVGADAMVPALSEMSPADAQALMVEFRLPYQASVEAFQHWWNRASQVPWSDAHIKAWQRVILNTLDEAAGAPYVKHIVDHVPELFPPTDHGATAYRWLARTLGLKTFSAYWPVFQARVSEPGPRQIPLEDEWPIIAMVDSDSSAKECLRLPGVWEAVRGSMSPLNVTRTLYMAIVLDYPEAVAQLKDCPASSYPLVDWMKDIHPRQDNWGFWETYGIHPERVDTATAAPWLKAEAGEAWENRWRAEVAAAMEVLPQTRARLRHAELLASDPPVPASRPSRYRG